MRIILDFDILSKSLLWPVYYSKFQLGLAIYQKNAIFQTIIQYLYTNKRTESKPNSFLIKLYTFFSLYLDNFQSYQN